MAFKHIDNGHRVFSHPEAHLKIVVSAIILLALAACGGSSSSGPATTGQTGPGSLTPALRPNCLDGTQANAMGADDVFYVNSWHLENTGSMQVVSAITNDGVAGIDANVKTVHQGGKGCTGKGITIAVVDNGMELAHEDLAANVLAGQSFNFGDNTDNPSPPPGGAAGNHGTAVAGIAAAQGWNGKGSRGLAPNASLVAYKIIGAPTKASGAAEVASNRLYLALGAPGLADPAIEATDLFGNRVDKVDVFNMSFGEDFGAPPAIPGNTTLQEALKRGTTSLRNGLGAVYVKSSGNGFDNSQSAVFPDGRDRRLNCVLSLPAAVKAGGDLAGGVFVNSADASCFDSNHDTRHLPFAYVTAAVHNTGRAASYSTSGAANWITGFGGESGTDQAALITADDSGCNAGINNLANKAELQAAFPLAGDLLKLVANLFGAGAKDASCNYTGTMNGTSAAAPSVSGVVALMLEVNPRLNWQDVGYILARTARKIDPGMASGTRAVSFTGNGATGPESTLVLDRPWQTNSAGFNFQNRYGFGLIDAAAATRLARGFAPPPGRRSNGVVAVVNSGDATSADIAGGKYSSTSANLRFADPVAVSGQMQVELLMDNLTSANVNPGRIQFEMTNNRTGQTSVLLPAFTAWYFGGQVFPLVPQGQQRFRFHTNAFYGDKLGDGYTVKTTYVKPANGVTGKLDFSATVTSFSM